MLSILAQETVPPEQLREEPVPERTPESGDFEIVLGKRQLAGVLFLATVVLAIFSAASYVVGEAVSPRKASAIENAAPPAAPVTRPPVATAPGPPVIVPVSADIVPPARPMADAALFAEPQPGALYLQLGAVEKGIALIFAEGLRTRGLAAFVATGPSDKIFRVLIGPLDQEGYRRSKDAIDGLGLTNFARRYQQ